jgi:hypothetical protein
MLASTGAKAENQICVDRDSQIPMTGFSFFFLVSNCDTPNSMRDGPRHAGGKFTFLSGLRATTGAVDR